MAEGGDATADEDLIGAVRKRAFSLARYPGSATAQMPTLSIVIRMF